MSEAKKPSKASQLTAEVLRRFLHYDPETGIFTAAANSAKRRKGQITGSVCTDTGYIRMGVVGSSQLGHRLAWLYMTGEWPHSEVDHVNMDRSDNRWENLRESTKVQNGWNTKKKKNNTSGFKGVHLKEAHKRIKKWHATISIDGKIKSLGYFYTAEDAGDAYAEAAKKYHGEFARTE